MKCTFKVYSSNSVDHQPPSQDTDHPCCHLLLTAPSTQPPVTLTAILQIGLDCSSISCEWTPAVYSHLVCRSWYLKPFWFVLGTSLVTVVIFNCIWVLWHTALQKAKVGPCSLALKCGLDLAMCIEEQDVVGVMKVTSGIGHSLWFCLVLFLTLREASCHAKRMLKQPEERPTWGGTEASCQHLGPRCQPREGASLELDPPATVKPSDNYSLGWHLDFNAVKDPTKLL